MMRALTVQQPWAAAMFRRPNPKDIENRTWKTDMRGRIAIHAGQRVDRDAFRQGVNLDERALARAERDRGAILGTVNLVGMHEAGPMSCALNGCRDNVWAHEPEPGRRLYHWEIESPREFVTPIRATGALQLWELGPSLEHLVEIAEVLP